MNFRMGWKTWNDRLSLILVVGIPCLWVADGLLKLNLNELVLGATILAWGNVVQYYFRRAPPEDTSGRGGGTPG